MIKRAVVIASGGIDSTTLLYKLREKDYELYVLTFLYGQKHSKEIGYASKICKLLEINGKIVDISSINELIMGSALTDISVDIPNVPETTDHYESLKSTIVPNRNTIFLSLAVAYAQTINSKYIFYGAHHSDRGVYPDCRKEFIESFEVCQRIANDNEEICIKAPFIELDKIEIVKLGHKLKVPYEYTWSCYKGVKNHCGICSSCRERKRAFIGAGINDPTVYED